MQARELLNMPAVINMEIMCAKIELEHYKKLAEQMKKNESEIERIEKKLSNEGFVSKAPAAVIEGERVKLNTYLETREALKIAIAKLG